MHHILLIFHLLAATIWVGGHLILSIGLLPKALKERDPEIITNFEKSYEKIGLPALNMSSSFIFVKNDLFLAYVNNYNHYVSYYRNTYQHGGISLEEMVIPFLVLEPR